MLAGEALGTVLYETEAMVEVLWDILKFNNGGAVFTPRGKALVLEPDGKLMQSGKWI